MTKNLKDWMQNDLHSFTNSGYKRSSYEEIAKWISEILKVLKDIPDNFWFSYV